MKKWVYNFDEVSDAEALVGSWDNVRGLLGGKGANLADMVRLGVPVPPGFTITTEACNAYVAADATVPEGMWGQVRLAMDHVEARSGKTFGDPSNPLLVSCRSGAKFSMPGMMDTVLDIGLNSEVVKQLAEISGDPHFAYDSYRRLIQMYGSVVLGHPDEPFEKVLKEFRDKRGVTSDSDLPTEDLVAIVDRFRALVPEFPDDPNEQLKLAVEAVFKSWDGKRATDYRNASNIPHDLGTAVNVQTMVFGNLGNDCLTGVAMSRHGATGENHIEGDYLFNAQGEDVVAGIRATQDLAEMATDMPTAHAELLAISTQLENHYRDMQDMEFTVENGKLWLLQTRDGKRTARAAVRIAVEMAEEGLISKEDAVLRVTPDQIDFFLHPQYSIESRKAATAAGDLLATGLNVSPGAAVGAVVFDADTAVEWVEQGKKVILVRPETRPDDVHGMLAAEGIVTSRGGRTSHAALVARQFGKPAVVGIAELDIDLEGRTMTVGERTIPEGGVVSIEGTSGEVFNGALPTVIPDINDRWLTVLLGWADGFRRLGVFANADYPADATRAREYGAQGIGLCRTEHMFFEAERLPTVQRMILAEDLDTRQAALDELLPMQRNDFKGLFEAMSGLPVIIRLIDPPLHEFLPGHDELEDELQDLEDDKSVSHDAEIERVEKVLARVDSLHEENPMLGFRGVRLGILMPEISRMQARAIFEAACDAAEAGFTPIPEVMIPLSIHVKELERLRALVVEVATAVMSERGITVDYKVGTMIETPRAALTAGPLAREAEFFSFGTNDLTQTTFAISRDDAEKSFLIEYVDQGILPMNPFQTIDRLGVGTLIKLAVEGGRAQRPGMDIGICGEHGGDPESIAICHELGLDYVSCSPFRVPVARLAAAHAALNE
ncbi:MAG: pyruvate, phosphate dikinase [Actinomycetota bacterium]|nr:pyruvate, phosphate dikinase [Actinomycetota bacterium]